MRGSAHVCGPTPTPTLISYASPSVSLATGAVIETLDGTRAALKKASHKALLKTALDMHAKLAAMESEVRWIQRREKYATRRVLHSATTSASLTCP